MPGITISTVLTKATSAVHCYQCVYQEKSFSHRHAIEMDLNLLVLHNAGNIETKRAIEGTRLLLRQPIFPFQTRFNCC